MAKSNPDTPQNTHSEISLRAIFQGLLLPLILLALAAGWLIINDPLKLFNKSTPPIEVLTFEQTILDSTGIHLRVRAGGTEPITIAQVQVDGAYWQFSQTPNAPLDRLKSTTIDIPYPWVAQEAHVVVLLTNTGATFEHEIEVALATMDAGKIGLTNLLLIGLFVGVLPVAIGMMFFPLFREFSPAGSRFVLALTLGLLTFLMIDMGFEAFELAHEAAPALQGNVLVILVAVFTAMALIALGRRDGPPRPLALAFYMALGIGLHNFGEGLAIGSALAIGSVGLSGFLVLGFSIHNITEGIGIASPLVRNPPKLIVFAGLALLAGVPAIIGLWFGTYALAPHWAAIAFAIGIGAIAQVLYEVGGLMARIAGGFAKAFDQHALAGFAVGLAFMYITAVAIKV